MTPFTGTIKELGPVSVTKMVAWVKAIPFEEWPQQSRTELKPAMVNDLAWHGFGEAMRPVVENLSIAFEGSPDKAFNHMLSVVMPGHSIPPHKDEQPEDWLYRIHIPLTTNSKAVTIINGKEHHMDVGRAYKVNTRAVHEVVNKGKTPRIHFMFDLRK